MVCAIPAKSSLWEDWLGWEFALLFLREYAWEDSFGWDLMSAMVPDESRQSLRVVSFLRILNVDFSSPEVSFFFARWKRSRIFWNVIFVILLASLQKVLGN